MLAESCLRVWWAAAPSDCPDLQCNMIEPRRGEKVTNSVLSQHVCQNSARRCLPEERAPSQGKLLQHYNVFKI